MLPLASCLLWALQSFYLSSRVKSVGFRTSIVAHQIKMPPGMLAIHINTSSSPSCSSFCPTPRSCAWANSVTWPRYLGPCHHMGFPHGFRDSRLEPGTASAAAAFWRSATSYRRCMKAAGMKPRAVSCWSFWLFLIFFKVKAWLLIIKNIYIWQNSPCNIRKHL